MFGLWSLLYKASVKNVVNILYRMQDNARKEHIVKCFLCEEFGCIKLQCKGFFVNFKDFNGFVKLILNDFVFMPVKVLIYPSHAMMLCLVGVSHIQLNLFWKFEDLSPLIQVSSSVLMSVRKIPLYLKPRC